MGKGLVVVEMAWSFVCSPRGTFSLRMSLHFLCGAEMQNAMASTVTVDCYRC